MTVTLRERELRGALAYRSGLAAEQSVERDYLRRGHAFAARRWRGKSGEIDLVLRNEDGLVFVEVKKAATFDLAVERLGPRQIARVMAAATEFLAGEPTGMMTGMRFDVALVDDSGQIRIIENALFE